MKRPCLRKYKNLTINYNSIIKQSVLVKDDQKRQNWGSKKHCTSTFSANLQSNLLRAKQNPDTIAVVMLLISRAMSSLQ